MRFCVGCQDKPATIPEESPCFCWWGCAANCGFSSEQELSSVLDHLSRLHYCQKHGWWIDWQNEQGCPDGCPVCVGYKMSIIHEQQGKIDIGCFDLSVFADGVEIHPKYQDTDQEGAWKPFKFEL